MKKQVLLFLGFCVLSLVAISQNNVNLVVFSEDGDPFYAYVNGVKQNKTPETNVKVTGLSPNISLRIEFEDKALPQLKQNMALDPGFEHTARIKRDMKKQMKLRYFGRVPIEEASSGVPTVAYHSAENGQDDNGSVYNTSSTGSQGNFGTNTSVTTTSTTTVKSTTKANPDDGNVAVNMNMAGVGISMNVNGMENNSMGTTMNTTTSTTVTSTHSGSTYNNSTIKDPTMQSQGGQATSSAAPAKTGCSMAMSPAAFAKMKQSIESKPFSDTKMSTARVATKNACLSVSQVKELCKLFSMDDDKLAYAKYAYDYCVDKANYYQVSDVFSFSATTDEFNKFIEEH